MIHSSSKLPFPLGFWAFLCSLLSFLDIRFLWRMFDRETFSTFHKLDPQKPLVTKYTHTLLFARDDQRESSTTQIMEAGTGILGDEGYKQGVPLVLEAGLFVVAPSTLSMFL